jgi:two-component system response regulator AlgR
MRVIIVDDEAPARARLRDLLADCSAELPLEVVGEAATGRAALELLSTESADVALLDIRMPEMDGLELAQHLQHIEGRPAVIFTTAFDAYAIRAFEVHAVDYLLKPIRAARLLEALRRTRITRPAGDALRALRPEARAFLCAPERGKIHLIPVGEVVYLKAELKYVTVRTSAREYLVEETLSGLEQEFGERFVRVHRNCLVARAAILGFEREAEGGGDARWMAIVKGCDEKIAVSRRQQHIVRELGGT